MPAPDKKPRTLYDKVFQDHIVDEKSDGTVLLYIGRPFTFGVKMGTDFIQTDISYTRSLPPKHSRD